MLSNNNAIRFFYSFVDYIMFSYNGAYVVPVYSKAYSREISVSGSCNGEGPIFGISAALLSALPPAD